LRNGYSEPSRAAERPKDRLIGRQGLEFTTATLERMMRAGKCLS
jgi:hypothetical protein